MIKLSWFSDIGKSITSGLNTMRSEVTSGAKTFANDEYKAFRKTGEQIYTATNKYVSPPVKKDLGIIKSDYQKGTNDVSQAVTKSAHSVYSKMSSVLAGTEKSAVKGVSSVESDFGNFGHDIYNGVDKAEKTVYSDADLIYSKTTGALDTAGKDVSGFFSGIWHGITGFLKEFEIPIIIIVVLIIIIAMFMLIR